ncbi:Permease of the drug/metabolite transporter (DMT) superfamily [Pseudomonas sp. R4-34-07]|uniref:DMT family transporter n=1 Tax=Pseudomonas sp. R4-34-07 TaxID=658642 RepID=UPI000F58DCB5|nr:DMT family transporter [Pseudomonas sp. R4-34-07]AZF53983.1 Permease of the drug/metabolite transporter (DMT) superfamily [Pseudomonas sp. R4-34-07]
MSPFQKSLLLVAGMALIWGAGLPVSKVGVQAIGAWPFRLACASISVLFLYAIFWSPVNRIGISLDPVLYFKFFIIAVPNVFLVPVLNNIALERLSISDSTSLIYTMPCFTSFFAMILNRKLDIFSIASLVFCLSGVGLIIGSFEFSSSHFIILSSAIAWSIGSIISQRLEANVEFRVKVFWQITFGCLCVFLVSPLFISWPTEIIKFSGNLSLPVVASVLFMGVVGGAIVFYIWFYLIELQNAEYASYATLFSPIISIILAIAYFGETPSTSTMIGFSLILISALIVNIVRPALISKTNQAAT